MARIRVGGLEIMLNDSPPVHAFTFTPSTSTFIDCEDEAQLRALAEKLGDGGAVMMPVGSYGFSTLFTWIADRFGVQLSLASIGALLARLGLTPQKPLQRAYERDPGAIEAWKAEVYPKLAARAKKLAADIYFWDEAGFRADAVQGLPASGAFTVHQYGVAAAMLSAALRLMKISHVETQKILYELNGHIVEAYEQSAVARLSDMSGYAPLTEILTAVHARAHVRLFMN